MSTLQYIGYGALILVILYLLYVIASSVIGFIFKLVIYGGLLIAVVYFAYKFGWIDQLKKFW